jgi:hypothetical protein
VKPTFKCSWCKREKPLNPRLRGKQKFCGDHACQKARKRQWQHKQLNSDASYRSEHRKAQEAWRKNYPADLYQRNYRENHPEYVECNRAQQRVRNRNRRVIVKMDALSHNKTDTYILRPYPKKIVKMDTLLFELVVLQKDTRPTSTTVP